MSKQKRVLLTGLSGFLGSHTTIQLLEKGYQVVGTMRNLSRAEKIKTIIARHTSQVEHLSIVEADLLDDAVWGKLMDGIDYVQHIASPFPRVLPKNDQELIVPAKQGTLSVLRAAVTAGVQRVVLTSSSGAIVYGKAAGQESGTYTEKDWTDVQNKKDTTPYFRSKTIAERAAWDFVGDPTIDLELTTVCPGAILGPVLEEDFGTSANIVIKTMDGSTPAIPNIGFDIVDVRSVADLLIRAMEQPAAAHERFVGSAGFLSFQEVAAILRKAYPHKKIPKRSLPDFAVRLFSYLDPTLKPILNDLGKERRVSNQKAKDLLGWNPIDNEQAVLACAESVIAQGIVQ